MTMPPRSFTTVERQPFHPQDFDEPCEGCSAPAGSFCYADCDCGYTAEDAQAEAARRSRRS
ncbi:hypothetical protein ACTVZO_41410 [Streptomyces sp. IBSNAI002]|uniref:hypothetical protein n=1 Tax=Streptomyces sp. IBSNAI002 TaxID=3457500 RepID=UPI003FD025A3